MGVPGIDWSERAAIAERAIVRRHLRRVAGVLPGTRIARIRWPRRVPASPKPWHFWWQAQLLDCLVDAQLRDPSASRARTIAKMTRTVRLRNLGSWTNRYYDDTAWLGLAVHRAGALTRSYGAPALTAITQRLHEGWSEDGGGGIVWHHGDHVKNAPSNGPAAILLARVGQLDFASSIVDWVADTLVDPETGLVRNAVRLAPDGSVQQVVRHVYTYCQGAYLGACVELAERDGHWRWTDRAAGIVDAITNRLVNSDGVLPGGGGGDGGLFAGILARYLADAAVRRPALAPTASRLVLASAEAAWDGRAEVGGGPVFAADWSTPAAPPCPGAPEADLSVQLAAWMLLEAAARIQQTPNGQG